MNTKIQIREFSTMPLIALEGWNPNACSGSDYDTPRADALYAALGVSKSDEGYALAQHTDGRWALFGLTATGHRFAIECDAPIVQDVKAGVQTRWIETLYTPSARLRFRVIAPSGWTDEQVKDGFRTAAKRFVGYLFPAGQTPATGGEYPFGGEVRLGGV